ncbi:MAG: alpha/beta hydrolase [Pseudomonadota bacterium]
MATASQANRPTPPIGHQIQAGDLKLHCVEAGPEGAPPLVLLHGASGNLRDMTLSLLGPLSASRRAIAFDRPGFGYSEAAPVRPWSLAAQVAVLRAGLLALGVERYALVGHSYSGALVLDWALTHPEEVTGLGILGGATMDWGGALSPHYRLLSAPILGTLIANAVPRVIGERTLARLAASIFAPQEMPPRYVEAGGVDLALRPESFRLNARQLDSLWPQIKHNQPRYREITCPVEIVHGQADRIVPARIHAERLVERLPDARLTLLEGIGHMPHHAAPRRIAEVLLRLP